jgi:hypothetical protein
MCSSLSFTTTKSGELRPVHDLIMLFRQAVTPPDYYLASVAWGAFQVLLQTITLLTRVCTFGLSPVRLQASCNRFRLPVRTLLGYAKCVDEVETFARNP